MKNIANNLNFSENLKAIHIAKTTDGKGRVWNI